jgi:uncharacterized repeat protein (TIGR03809 family)
MYDSTTKSWRPEVFARKWHALAERRRNHLKELYDSGAWKRYFTEEVLRTQMREAAREAEHWGAMLDHQAAAAPEAGEAPSSSPRAA